MNTQFPHIFGPVPSRRLGLSLGIDMIPMKTCSLNCAYCECGKTTLLTIERKPFVSAETILNEIDCYLASAPQQPDVITFAGSGEPTLNADLGAILTATRKQHPSIKTALLTNSTLLHLDSVRKEILDFDYVLPSLDAISEPVFKKINNPAQGLTSKMVITGLEEFSKIYKGQLWVEVFIIEGVNDTPEELSLFKKHLTAIKPTRIQLNALDRPGAFEWVKTASYETLRHIADFLKPLPVEIISRKSKTTSDAGTQQIDPAALLATIERRPLTVEDIALTFSTTINAAENAIGLLLADKAVTIEIIGSRKFYATIKKGNQ